MLRETPATGAATFSHDDTRIIRHRVLARLDRRPVQHRHRFLRELPMPQSLRTHERLARAQFTRHRPVVGQRRHFELAVKRQQQLVAIRMPLPRRLPRVAHHAERQIPDLRDVAHGSVSVLAGRVRRDIEMRHLAQRGAQVMLLQLRGGSPAHRSPRDALALRPRILRSRALGAARRQVKRRHERPRRQAMPQSFGADEHRACVNRRFDRSAVGQRDDVGLAVHHVDHFVGPEMTLPMRALVAARRDQQMIVHRVEEPHRHVGQIAQRGAHVMHDKLRLPGQLLEALFYILMRDQRLAATAPLQASFDCAARSAFRRVRKSARGKSRNSPAIRKIAASRGSDVGSDASGFAIIASTAWSSCSISFPLAIRITQPHPQILQAAELKLLNAALGSPERSRDFANRFILREPHDDHPRLIARQPLDKFEQPSPPLRLFDARRHPAATASLS